MKRHVDGKARKRVIDRRPTHKQNSPTTAYRLPAFRQKTAIFATPGRHPNTRKCPRRQYSRRFVQQIRGFGIAIFVSGRAEKIHDKGRPSGRLPRPKGHGLVRKEHIGLLPKVCPAFRTNRHRSPSGRARACASTKSTSSQKKALQMSWGTAGPSADLKDSRRKSSIILTVLARLLVHSPWIG